MPKQALNKEKLQSELLTYLRRQGLSSSQSLCQTFKISQPTLSRILSTIKDKLLIIGKAQNTKYAVIRKINNVTTPVPLYEIIEEGNCRHLGVLHALEPHGFYFESQIISEAKSEFYPDLPYFLNDLRPTGFLGRLIPTQHTDLNLPNDIKLWTAEHCLAFLSNRGWNCIGNFILGEQSFQLYLQNHQSIAHGIQKKNRENIYAQFANNVLSTGDVGSSAAGEQPKFMTMLLPEIKHVLVKFSPPFNTEIGRRVADLMISEQIALRVLKKNSQQAADTEILMGENRLFLEVERFDRGNNFSRYGLISLGSLDAEFAGISGTWSKTSQELIKQKILPQSFYEKIRWLELFGNLIANTDMHLYNLSFFTKGLRIIELAPVYDMLPMLFMPRNNQILQIEFKPPLPSPEDGKIWHTAHNAACDFWNEVLMDARISVEFKRIAQQSYDKITMLKDIAHLLPKN
jgi:hypothetical protein